MLFVALFLVSKTTCTYHFLQIALGVDLVIQGTSILWAPDLFTYFLSIGEAYPGNLPSWKDRTLFTKVRFTMVSLFILFLGCVSFYTGLIALRQMDCF